MTFVDHFRRPNKVKSSEENTLFIIPGNCIAPKSKRASTSQEIEEYSIPYKIFETLSADIKDLSPKIDTRYSRSVSFTSTATVSHAITKVVPYLLLYNYVLWGFLVESLLKRPMII